MRIAIPVKEGVGLDATIDASLSECRRLLVIDTDEQHLRAWKVVGKGSLNDLVSIEKSVQIAVGEFQAGRVQGSRVA